MTDDLLTAPSPAAGALRALPQHCKLCGHEQDAAPEAICDVCLGPLEPHYPENRRVPTHAEIERSGPFLEHAARTAIDRASDVIRALEIGVKQERLIQGEPSERSEMSVEEVTKREMQRWLVLGGEVDEDDAA